MYHPYCRYGRGGADDGYAIFAAVNSVKVLQAQKQAHPRCCIIIEGSEESGSTDLMYYVDKLKKRIGTPRYFILCPILIPYQSLHSDFVYDLQCGDLPGLWMSELRSIVDDSVTERSIYGVFEVSIIEGRYSQWR